MDAGKHDRLVELICPTCAGTQFARESEEGPLRCVGCERVFSAEELIKENGHILQAGIDEMANAVVKDLEKQFTANLRNAFRGSKNIRFK